MQDIKDTHHRTRLQKIARRAMLEKGLVPDFPADTLAELDQISGPAAADENKSIRDLRNLLWCSIDNDDSRDLDQLTVAESKPDGAVKVLVAIADVDALVKNGSAIDDRARQNTTSVYTAAEIFPMLPEKLSTDFTSLNYESDRLAVVVEMVLDAKESCRVRTYIEPSCLTRPGSLTTVSRTGWKMAGLNRKVSASQPDWRRIFGSRIR